MFPWLRKKNMSTIRQQLNTLYKTKTMLVNKASRGGKTYGLCTSWSSNRIVIYTKMKGEYQDVTWVHEWFHHYQYFVYPKQYRKRCKTKAVHSPPTHLYAAENAEEEECEAFALLIVRRSKEYDLTCPETKLWLVRMWFHLRNKYPDLTNILERNRPY